MSGLSQHITTNPIFATQLPAQARVISNMNFRQPNEDLFESSRMSFGDHLEELRKVLIKALYGVAIGCVFGFLFANQVVQVLVQPLKNAIEEYETQDAKVELTGKYNFVPPEYLPWIDDERMAPRQVKIAPKELVEAISELVPDLGTTIKVEPYSFRQENIESGKLAEFCQQLSSPSGSDKEVVAKRKALWAALSPIDHATLKRVAATKGEASQADTQSVVGVINQLSKNESIYKLTEFEEELAEKPSGLAGLFASKKPRPLARIKQNLIEKFDVDLNRRLNLALIASTFPDQVAPPKANLKTIEIWESTEFKPQALGVGEGFGVWLKAGLFTGLTIAGPWVFYQLWSFVAAGLYPHERKHIHVFLPISIALFAAGVLLAFFFVFQPVLGFLFSFNRSMGIAPEMRINDWLSFVMFLPLGFGIAFQLPLVMLFMNRIGLFEVEDYLAKWRVAVMIIFVLAMFLTPADPISMMLLAVPLSLLYFLGIGMCKWMPRSENPFGEDAVAVQ